MHMVPTRQEFAKFRLTPKAEGCMRLHANFWDTLRGAKETRHSPVVKHGWRGPEPELRKIPLYRWGYNTSRRRSCRENPAGPPVGKNNR